VEEMNFEKNDEQYYLYKKEESFQDIVDESRTLEVVGNKDKDECIQRLETPHSIKGNNILDQPRIEFIELWFQSIVGEAMQSDPPYTWSNFSPVHIESTHDSLVQVSTCFNIL
jgi:hypothetical protein